MIDIPADAVEAVARSIAHSYAIDPDAPWNERLPHLMGLKQWSRFSVQARAAITAYLSHSVKDVILRSAAELAPQLDELLDQLMSTCGDASAKKELAQWLWDNKVGMLRIMQAMAALSEMAKVSDYEAAGAGGFK